jgi:hypothetical protein
MPSIDRNDRFEARIRRIEMRVVNVCGIQHNDNFTINAANGVLEAEVEIRIPNRKISGDYRVVVQVVPLANLDFIPLQDGDGD